MDTSMIIILVIAVVAVLAIAAGAWMLWQKKRSERLRSRFGPEYERVVESGGDRRRRAESVLVEREKRIEKLEIRPLSNEDRTRFAQAWNREQARFVDDPRGAVAEADRLIGEVMKARGYPTGEFEQRAADISVDHPTVANYRIAHEIATKDSRGEAGTEELRRAMVHYRALFEDLLETRAAAAKGGRK